MANSADSSCSNFKDLLVSHSQTRQENGQYLSESSSSEVPTREPPVPNLSKLLRGKGREWEAIKAKPRPLQLLDLPVDILRLIVKEVTHTNDLTSLALTNSTLYYLTVPHIYARFDIVWPDDTVPPSDSKNVDALTYGLATLCLGSKFAQRSRWLRGSSIGNLKPSQRLVDNQYAKYTRKFSLGNGPKDWTSEYEVTKESGKMLGTLVAIAVGKMINLETFVWDMPTGVLSEVFMALASLQDHYPEGESKLEKVWVRWHDNSEVSDPTSSISSPIQPPPPPPLAIPPIGSTVTPVGHTLPSDFHPSVTQPIKYSESHVEHPTFSILPSLKSLTVLDIDELAYLDEMSVLIDRSRYRLRELRVGISSKARLADFAQSWDSYTLQQVDHDAQWPGESRIGDRRLGGVLGVLVGRIYDIRRKPATKMQERQPADPAPDQSSAPQYDGVEEFGSLSSNGITSPITHIDAEMPGQAQSQNQRQHETATPVDQTNGAVCVERSRLDGKLQLETLELERVPLSLQVCTKAIDWSVLTNLTILDCMFVDNLWRALKRQFHPTPPVHGSPAGTPAQYHLGLKHIHTDMTSSTLLGFIKDTLAPNSLEVLFLQDRRRTLGAVKIGQIFKGAIKRHRLSLKKLLLDSSDESGEGRRWASWVLSSEIVSYITSGRMPNLKELSAAFDYKDWHPFLQRLPNAPQLRSLHISHISEHISVNYEPKELALQLVDIITLRPEIQLCYVGIGSKCFEILEARPNDSNNSDAAPNGDQHGNGAIVIDIDDDNEDDGSEDDETEEDDDDVNDDNTNGNPTDAADDFTDVSDAESETESVQDGDLVRSAARLRLREILFYDDKVAIFKARHGRL
ncbi:hypothetical protein F4818DRAFT_163544 [Hypoxylon cercidicola]|nr:hypothetical protein F4818DRAFT_163544 [Hypoxylon cercidicola]